MGKSFLLVRNILRTFFCYTFVGTLFIEVLLHIFKLFNGRSGLLIALQAGLAQRLIAYQEGLADDGYD